MKEIKRPDAWTMCLNAEHWKDILIWGKCDTCKKTIHEPNCECWECMNEIEKEESDMYDLATHPLS